MARSDARFDVVTLFPEMFTALTGAGIVKRAHDQAIFSMHCWNPRDFTDDAYRRVDDRPFGGGPGMVMLAEPLDRALDAVQAAQRADALQAAPVLYLSPSGERLSHALVMELAQLPALTLLCGRYEGVDERLLNGRVDRQVSIGDFVVSGGELPAMLLIDAIVRQLPGVLNDAESAVQDSFVNGLLDCPQYTRPEIWAGEAVPSVLTSGNHADIAKWRREQSLRLTAQRRPDLILQARADAKISTREVAMLEASQVTQQARAGSSTPR
jgi:tRNA (guanine37-N1)-methyltransferase